MDNSSSGSLVCVGVGITLGSHISPLARSHIEGAQVVFTGVSDAVVEMWLQQMNPDVRSLQPFYGEGIPRMETYRRMVEAMLAEVRLGKKVCGAFYGHPGVFAWAPHRAIAQARLEGFAAHMEPGISSEDCLYADLGIDPGQVGCQHYEASQFMNYRRQVDTSAWLVLWQVGVAGDSAQARFATGPAYLELLVEVLERHYGPEHEVILYQAATLPIQVPRMDRLRLADLPQAATGMGDTLVIAPARPLDPDPQMRARLAALGSLQ
ncbi:SAM-dependent methyltransferase [Dyella sp.]|uniref:SAM-dependent methyltransferase n=1 Tax=Dyella sp. TaxID=1869338 RepID=UPI002ED2C28F